MVNRFGSILNRFKINLNRPETISVSAGTLLLIGVFIADHTDTVLPNADKNHKITETNHKNIENQIHHFIST